MRFLKRQLKHLNTIGAAALLAFSLAIPAFAQDGSAKDDADIDDDKIVNAIEGELFGAKAVDGNAIDVTVNKGIVTLKGDVKNILCQDRAVRIAQMTKGVRSVVDQTKIKTNGRSDSAIKTDIVAALASDPATDSWEITVEVNEGSATLEGEVDSYAERNLAGKVAQTVRGLTGLQNDIKVDYKTDRLDTEIKAEIEQRLNWDVRLDDELVTVDVKDGKVTLDGTVGSAYEKTLARSDAWVAGVNSVDDKKLTVEWWSRDKMQRKTAWQDLKDEEIKDAVKAAFLYDPRVFSFNPEVTVENGVVTLSGTVENLKAKRSAAQDAKNTVGVWRVKNNLKVRPTVSQADEQISQNVKTAFLRDPYVDRYEITTYVSDGEVSLYGAVDSWFEKSQAEDLAARVSGVSEVNNYLSVPYAYPDYEITYYDWDPALYDYDFDYQTTMKKPDGEIKDEIESELWWSPMVSYDKIKVSVEDGIATLTGTVDTWSERMSAAENAIEGGAVKVINKLEVDY